ncbi:hypothetical protein GCM10027568_10070 [Humibacter soli]
MITVPVIATVSPICTFVSVGVKTCTGMRAVVATSPAVSAVTVAEKRTRPPEYGDAAAGTGSDVTLARSVTV